MCLLGIDWENSLIFYTQKYALQRICKNNFEEYFQSVHMIYILSAQTISR